MKLIPATIFSLTILSTSCSTDASDSGSIMPRRHAYPRIEIPDSVYNAPEDLPMGLQTATGTVAETKRDDSSGQWVDVDYPKYGASIHYTFTTVKADEIDGIIDNRLQRIALNAGSNEVELNEFTTQNGMTARVIVSLGGVGTTPVQFLATDDSTVVVSGVAYLPVSSGVSRDSIAPVITMLRRDIVHSLKTLSR